MTIEIRQLVIRAIVESHGASDEGGRAAPTPPLDARPRSPAQTPTQALLDREALVAACVREVLRELRRSTER